MKKIFFSIFLFVAASCFAQMKLNVFPKIDEIVDETRSIGTLTLSDTLVELPIPMEKVQKVKYVNVDQPVKDRKGRTVTITSQKKVITYEDVQPSEPPKYVPIRCRFGEVWVKRGDLARFLQEARDIGGVYASSTGTVVVKRSPNSPKKFSIVIRNGNVDERAEIEMGDLEVRDVKGHSRFTYKEDGCTVVVDVFNHKLRVAQRGCDDYNDGPFKLEGNYPDYRGNKLRAETFNLNEYEFTFEKFLWCGSGFDSCEKIKDENGDVTITWSKGGKGYVERRAGSTIHTYRPFENVIPHKRDFFHGEKPIVLKTKRTDMSGEWMLWYFYPKAGRLKMVRAGMREDSAYMEIYEKDD